MAEPQPRERSRPALTLGSDDWPADLADRIVSVIGTVRSRTTDNVVRVARAMVYGLVAVAAAAALVVLLTIIAVRLADAYLPIGDGVGSATWAAHGFIGLLVSILAGGAWRARHSTFRPLKSAIILDVVLIVAVVFYGVIRAVA